MKKFKYKVTITLDVGEITEIYQALSRLNADFIVDILSGDWNEAYEADYVLDIQKKLLKALPEIYTMQEDQK